MRRDRIENLTQKFKDKKICVIGDVMIDRYILGDIHRISPEAPVPVVLAEEELVSVGGAANVAANITSLGGLAFLISVIGKDRGSQDLLNRFARLSINPAGILRVAGRPTTEKMRIVARNQQIVRVDRELQNDIDTKTEIKLLNFLKKHAKDFDGFVISDYAKGVVTEMIAFEAIRLAKKLNKFIIADIKPQHAGRFRGITLVAPNEKEALAIAENNDVVKAGKFIQNLLRSHVLITRGHSGMMLFSKGRHANFPAKAKDVYDVTGAGDTVMAALSLALAAGASFKEAVVIANHAAGIVVGKTGTSTVSTNELKKEIFYEVKS